MIRGKNFAFLLAAVFCLADTVGDDWRNSDEVVASGTIPHEDASVDVLVTVDENSAAFYWDEPEQILFDSVSFPMTIPDAQEYFNDISFDDIDGDGESDVSLSFVYFGRQHLADLDLGPGRTLCVPGGLVRIRSEQLSMALLGQQ